jgi:tRNA pseudouridine38-40 synthase
VTGEKIRVVGAGRTDTGVHAKGQVISFSTQSRLETLSMIRALNFYLAPHIAVVKGSEVHADFNARRDAISRSYRYSIFSRETPSPLYRNHALFIPLELDIDSMNEACKYIIGKHDFASFTGTTDKNTWRDVESARLKRDRYFIHFEITANAFLRKQIRSTIGSLIRVGLKKMMPDEFGAIVKARNPGMAAPVAPAHGLCLMHVSYSNYPLLGDQS